MPNETHRLNEVIKYEFYHHRETGSSAEPTTAWSPRGIEARNTHTHTNNRSTMDTKLNHTSSSTPGTKHRHRHRKPSWTGGSRAPSLLHSRVLAAPKLQPSLWGSCECSLRAGGKLSGHSLCWPCLSTGSLLGEDTYYWQDTFNPNRPNTLATSTRTTGLEPSVSLCSLVRCRLVILWQEFIIARAHTFLPHHHGSRK